MITTVVTELEENKRKLKEYDRVGKRLKRSDTLHKTENGT